MRLTAASIVSVFGLCLCNSQTVRAEPKTEHLIAAGAGFAIPTYFLGVALHEGSHALVAKIAGAEILDFKVLPSREPTTGAFYFGYVRYQGQLSNREKILFYTAPKLVDLAVLGAYSALLFTGSLPENRYGRMALAVFATGSWVDFSKDLASSNSTNDTVRAYELLGFTNEWQRLPLRALQLGISVAAGYVLYRGYEGVFAGESRERTRMIPLYTGFF